MRLGSDAVPFYAGYTSISTKISAWTWLLSEESGEANNADFRGGLDCPDWTIKKYAAGSRRASRYPGEQLPTLLAQQSADFLVGVIDFDLKHRISRLQSATGGFCTVGCVKLRLEMAVDNCRKSLGWGPVGSHCLLRLRLINRENGLFHHFPLTMQRS
jgi:hypothetical protein